MHKCLPRGYFTYFEHEARKLKLLVRLKISSVQHTDPNRSSPLSTPYSQKSPSQNPLRIKFGKISVPKTHLSEQKSQSFCPKTYLQSSILGPVPHLSNRICSTFSLPNSPTNTTKNPQNSQNSPTQPPKKTLKTSHFPPKWHQNIQTNQAHTPHFSLVSTQNNPQKRLKASLKTTQNPLKTLQNTLKTHQNFKK